MKHDLQILDECTPHLGEATDSFPLSIVIIYNDMHAALRAAQTLERLGNKFRGQMRQRIQPVPVAQLRDPALFDHLLSDAGSADMIIVSYNGPGDFPAPLKKWVAGCLGQKREGDSAVIALLSSHERMDAPESHRYRFLKNITQAAGMDFLAPTPAVAEEQAYILEQMDLAG